MSKQQHIYKHKFNITSIISSFLHVLNVFKLKDSQGKSSTSSSSNELTFPQGHHPRYSVTQLQPNISYNSGLDREQHNSNVTTK